MVELSPPEQEIQHLLTFVSKNEASDLHIKVGYPPCVRIGGHLRRLQLPQIPDTTYVEGMFRTLLPPDRWREFEAKGSVDFSTMVSFVNATSTFGGVALMTLAAGDVVTLRNNSATPFTMMLAPAVGAQLTIEKVN